MNNTPKHQDNQTMIWRQIAAFIYDIFPVLGILISTSLIIVLLRGGKEIETSTLWLQLLLVAEIFTYYTYSWKRGGQTLGMRAWKIKIQSNSNRLSWPQLTLRFISGLASFLSLGMGLWWQYIDNKKRTWMDIASQSTVILTPPPINPHEVQKNHKKDHY